jgi:hypothetical protein
MFLRGIGRGPVVEVAAVAAVVVAVVQATAEMATVADSQAAARNQ